MRAPRSERKTQNRVVELFEKQLDYDYLGGWGKRENNRNIEVEYLRANLQRRGYSDVEINAAVFELQKAGDVVGTTLYNANLRTYELLRFGVPVQIATGEAHKQVQLIDWENPQANHFALAEEVTLRGDLIRRPDIVLYINGIAVAVIELKRGSVEVAYGIRQLGTLQEPLFHQGFFSTVQLTFAGNDAQGLHYGTVGTPETQFVQWRDEAPPPEPQEGDYLDRPLAQMCGKQRLLDILRNFIIFDAGMKKVPRPHQYAGIKAAQERIRKKEGGVIWHTQGSGKSILMVLLAKWVLENDPDARVLIVTDRDELDKQITGVMKNAGVIGKQETGNRINSRVEFVQKLAATTPRLLCALLHKFDTRDLEGAPPPVFGNFYVFVDEAHRTQGGDMNKQMKRWLGNALFIGFTGTPLLRKDKRTTREVFGTYIHTYKFPQAVADKVVLDLKYEARAVPQQLTSKDMVDKKFAAISRGLNNYQKAALRKRWATMQELLSSKNRMERIIASIIEDFDTRPRLSNDRGTAILVADEIYDACQYFRLFQDTPLGRKVGIITSFEPNAAAIATEPANGIERYKYDTYKQYVLGEFASTAAYETEIKRRFIEEPANCKLVVVVSKLLTGFDAPSCTYIYLDRNLRDHDLFQAICRTNRIDGDDKDYGHIVDFKELFKNVQDAIAVYSSDELDIDSEGDGSDGNVVLKDWIKEGRKNIEQAREALLYLCEPVLAPRELEQYLHYFCGEAEDAEALANTEPLRISFYKLVTAFVRAFAELSSELDQAGYAEAEAFKLKKEVGFYSEIRDAIKQHSGEEFDIKPFEADMRYLLNTYVQAEDAQPLGDMGDLSLVELIVESGIHDAIAKKFNAGKTSNKVVAEGIINNVRKAIVQEKLTDPRFYEQMSKLLDDLIKQSRKESRDYEAFLKKAEDLARKLAEHQSGSGEVPEALQGQPVLSVIYRNLPGILAANEDGSHAAEEKLWHESELVSLTMKIDAAMSTDAPHGWRGDEIKERVVRKTLLALLDGKRPAMLKLFDLLKNQQGYQ
ncbi:MAG: type I restriction endonuclease subunit R [Pseudoxanthomonas sp.]